MGSDALVFILNSILDNVYEHILCNL